MDKRIWGVLALVLLTLAGVVFGTMIGPVLFGVANPDAVPDETVPESAVIPDAEPPSQPAPADAPAPIEEDGQAAGDNTAAGGEGAEPGPDLTPERVSLEQFEEVMEAVNDSCGLGGWSEFDRSCTEVRCSALLVQAVQADTAPPSPGSVTLCSAWQEAWGPAVDTTSDQITCEDGTELHVALISPSTLELQRLADQGEADVFPADRDALATLACQRWGG